jgi:hypothetical protein
LIEIYEQKQLAYSWPAEALPIFSTLLANSEHHEEEKLAFAAQL